MMKAGLLVAALIFVVVGLWSFHGGSLASISCKIRLRQLNYFNDPDGPMVRMDPRAPRLDGGDGRTRACQINSQNRKVTKRNLAYPNIGAHNLESSRSPLARA
jgi:hypothetical protein